MIRVTPAGAIIEGELTVKSIPALIEKGYTVIERAPESVTFDFSQVSAVDSVSLALLIDWMRYAKRHQKVLHFKQLPEKVMQMMKLSNLVL